VNNGVNSTFSREATILGAKHGQMIFATFYAPAAGLVIAVITNVNIFLKIMALATEVNH